jgi:CheY-like chemotaxis protein
MPHMNGWELRKQLANNPALARVPVLVTTAFGSDVGIEAEAVLVKPVDIERLLAIVDRIYRPFGTGGADIIRSIEQNLPARPAVRRISQM